MSETNSISKRSVPDIVESLSFCSVHKWLIFATMLGFMFDAFEVQILSVAMPVISKEFKMDGMVIGLVSSASLWGMFIGALIAGPLSDLIGRRGVMIATILGYSLATGLVATATGPMYIVTCRFITGLFLGALVPIDVVYLAEMTPLKYRGPAIAAMGITWSVGMLFAAYGAALVIVPYGWRALFLVGIIPALIAFLVRFKVPESPRWLIKRGKIDKAIESLNRLGAGIKSADEIETVIVEKKGPATTAILKILFSMKYLRRTITAYVMYILQQIIMYGWSAWFPTIVSVVMGVNLRSLFVFVIIGQTGGLLGRIALTFLVDRMGRRTNLIITYSGIAIFACILSYLILKSAPITIFIAFEFCMEFFCNLTALQIYVSELFPSEARGTGMAWATSVGRVSGAVAPIVFGAFMAAKQPLLIMYTIVGIAILFVITVAFFCKVETTGQSLKNIGAE